MADVEKVRIVVTAEDDASAVLSNVESKLSSLSSGIGKINSALRQYNSSMSSLNRMMVNTVKDMGSAIYDFTSDSIDNFSELSEQHAKTLGAMANDYDKTIQSQEKFIQHSEKLKQQAIDLAKYGVNGAGSLVDPTSISAMQTELIKAGVKAEVLVDPKSTVLEDVLQFAQANQLDNAKAVEFAVSLGSQFKIPYEDWGDMLDKVSHTADMSVIDVDDIVASMKYAGGISSGIDRPMEEVLGMISVLGNFGLKGSQAGSGIQAFLTRLLTGDTTVITDAMAEVAPERALKAFYDFSNYVKSDGSEITYDDILNETFVDTDITGQLRPMSEIADVMESVMAELTDEEQAWFAKKLFGLYQMKSAYALINGDDSSEMALQDVIKEIEENSIGTNANKLAQLLESQDGQFKATKNLIESIKTELGDMLNPTVLAVLGEVQEFLKDPGNYEINWDRIQTSLDESCDAIEEAYGTAIADAVRNLGGFTIDLGRVVEEIAPEFVSGILDVINSLISFNFIGEGGVGESWENMISSMNDELEDLPPNLQKLGEKVISVVDMFGKLAALNVATTIAQLVSSVLQIALMTVHAGSVIVTGGTGVTGTKGGTGTGGAGAALAVSGKTKVGTADDVAKMLGTTVDDVVATFGKHSKYTLDDIAKGLGASTDDVVAAYGDDLAKVLTSTGKNAVSTFAKRLGIIGTIWQVGSTAINAYDEFSSGDTLGGAEEIAGGAGSMGGAALGAKGGALLGSVFGPIGTAIGGGAGAILGALMGDEFGRDTVDFFYNSFHPYDGPTIDQPPIPTPTPPEDFYDKKEEEKKPTTNSGPAPVGVPTAPVQTPKPTPELPSDAILRVNIMDMMENESQPQPPPTIAPAPAPTPTPIVEQPSATPIIPAWNVLSNEGRYDAITDLINNQYGMLTVPSVSIGSPQVQVDITIDKDGNVVSQKQSILNPAFNTQINNWYQKSSSQMGATTR